MGAAENTCAATDLVLAVIAFIAALRLHQIDTEKTEEKRNWVRFFLLLGAACFGGFIIHAYIPHGTLRNILWVFLFAALFEIGRRILVIAMGERFGLSRPTRLEKHLIIFAEVGLYLPAAIIPFVNGSNTIIYYIVFASVIAVLSVTMFTIEAFKGNSAAQSFLGSLLFAVPAILFQYTKRGNFHLIWDFDHNGASHLCLIGSIVMIYLGAKIALLNEYGNLELSESYK